jgi:hypothetical protein
MDKSSKIEITEIFMAKVGKNGWDRCFYDTIRRGHDEGGNPIVYGKIKVGDGYICAMAKDQWELGDRLDEMVLMILDKGLLNHAGMTTKIFETDFF